MKRISTIGFLIIALIFQNCKNNKTPQDNLDNKDADRIIEQKVESTDVVDTLEIDEEISSITEIEEIPAKEKAIASKRNSPDDDIIEEDNITEKPIVAEKEETISRDVVVEKELDNAIETEKELVEDVIQKPETESVTENVSETITEPKPIIDKPETVSSGNNWVVPAKYKTMKNPTDPKVDLTIGKNLYSKHCKSCHGKEGYGDGPKADEQDGDLGDFSTSEFQAQSDGALFYKTTIGRNDMPEYTKKIPDDEDRWLIVNYMRTLAE
ncbi:MAG: cytochrome c [Aureibaculum sp.]|nr:cytochrome c [Aureibaculum sp.]